jgi:HNH endonuclease
MRRILSNMLSTRFTKALATKLPVLFAYIGWTNEYDGTEPVRGTHGYLTTHPEDTNTSEARAFVKDEGVFRCGVGRGNGPRRLHVVFTARHTASSTMRVVGLYAAATLEYESDWSFAQTRTAVLIPVDRRPRLSVKWPAGQGIRRWAFRDSGQTHPSLLKYFIGLQSQLPRILASNLPAAYGFDQTYSGFEAREGKQKEMLRMHRSREVRLRKAKIRQVLESHDGRLACEVPGCGFDFLEQYGDLGYGYAHVHHLKPLGIRSRKGSRTTLDDLVVICANCHAMIHRGGECRRLTSLIR